MTSRGCGARQWLTCAGYHILRRTAHCLHMGCFSCQICMRQMLRRRTSTWCRRRGRLLRPSSCSPLLRHHQNLPSQMQTLLTKGDLLVNLSYTIARTKSSRAPHRRILLPQVLQVVRNYPPPHYLRTQALLYPPIRHGRHPLRGVIRTMTRQISVCHPRTLRRR